MAYQDFITENIAPYSATKIGVYNSSGVKVGIIPLTNIKPSFGTRLYRFGILSDVHHNGSDSSAEPTEDFRRALTYFNSKESVWATVICGDITEKGNITELGTYQTNVNECSPSTPVYTTVGNHDATTMGLNETNWKTYTGQLRVFEITKGNDHFLFLGQNKYVIGSNGTFFLDKDIDWLENKLEEYRNQRCFVIIHPFFPTRAGNFKSIYPSGNWLSGDQLTRLLALNDRYLNTIWFSGHSHWKWYLQKYEDKANIYKNNCGWCVHIPSCASPIDSDGVSTRVSMPLESEGAIVDVYDNYIDIRGMDLKNQKYLPIAQYRLDTTLVNIPAKLVSYTVTNTLSNATNSNSASSITDGSNYMATIIANTNYAIQSITVNMGGVDVTSTVVSGNSINIASVTGDIVIVVTTNAIPNSYIITNNLTNCTTSNSATSIIENSSYTATISPNNTYIFDVVTVTMGGIDITSTAYSNGSISIASVTGNIVITANCIENTNYTEDIIFSLDAFMNDEYSLIPNIPAGTSYDKATSTFTLDSAGKGIGRVGIPIAIATGETIYAKWDSYSITGGNTLSNKIGFAGMIFSNNQKFDDYIDFSNEKKLTATSDITDVDISVKASSTYTGTTPVSITIINFRIYRKVYS